MKTIFILLSFIISTTASSQLLKGEWEGSFTQDKKVYPIFLEFILNTDSTYSVLSYSKGGNILDLSGPKIIFQQNSAVVCTVYYKLLSPDSVYLEELEVIQPKNASQNCFQKMYLKIKPESDKITLEGNWESTSCKVRSSGKIIFTKKKVAG